MRVAIIGSGLMGGKLGILFARAGHKVVFSYSRRYEKLVELARQAGGNARAGSPLEAAREADAILLAVHWSRLDEVLSQVGDLSGKVIVSCCVPLNIENTELIIAHKSSGAEVIAEKVPGGRVVAAFQAVPSEVFFDVFEARQAPARPGLVYCGDDTH
jgi:predicted dinucleotide-binding enzyme